MFWPSRIGRNDTAAPRPAPPPEPLWFEWLALAGMLAFGAWLLGVRGVWALLLTADPTGLTLVIIVIFTTASLWCGARARELQRQRHHLRQTTGEAGGARHGNAIGNGNGSGNGGDSWVGQYLQVLRRAPDGRDGAQDGGTALDLLLECTHGPHQTAWWVNGLQLKLGLLGKVIGFSVLALHIGQLQNFDPAQSQELLKSLTSGLGIALLTTMVGLVGNILLGLQLTRLDRYADALVADCQRAGCAPQR